MPIDEIRAILRDTLGLGCQRLDDHAALLGAVPELDSMAVAGVITALEQQFGIAIADDEISARHFATLAALDAFVRGKVTP
jgi:acyl carrier protein